MHTGKTARPLPAEGDGVEMADVEGEDDVATRRTIQQQLQEREDILRLAVGADTAGVWQMDPATLTLCATPQFFCMLGLPPTDAAVAVAVVLSALHPDDRDRAVAEFGRVATSRDETLEAEYRIRRPDGQMGWLLSRHRVRRDTTDGPVRYIGIAIDITARRLAEQNLRDSEERYRTLVDNANDLVFSLDLDFRLISANPAVRRLLGYAPEELIGTSLSSYVPPEQLGKHKAMLGRKLAGMAAETRYEMQVIDRAGRVRTLETNSRLSTDPNGNPTAIHAIARDVTERKKYEEHLALTMRELSHRTKNLLAVVQAMARQVGRHTDSFDEFQERFTGCVQALAHCHDLLVDRDWQGAELHELVGLQLKPFGGLDETKFMAAGPTVLLKPQAMQVVGLALHELATNAAKHGALTTPAGSVRIVWEPSRSGDGIELTWTEMGGPPVRPPTRRGFGSTVLERMAASLDGEVSLAFPPEGLRWSLMIRPEHIAGISEAV